MRRLDVLLVSLVSIGCILTGSFALGETYSADYRGSSPIIDGILSPGEWGAAFNITMDRRDGDGEHNSDLYFQHDGTSLFMGVDSQWGSGGDVVWSFYIDGDHDGALSGNLSSPYVDLNIARPSPGGYSGYIAYNTMLSVNEDIKISSGVSASSGSTNVTYEFCVPLADLDVTPGDSVGIFFSLGYDGVTEHLYELPGASRFTPQDWAVLNLQLVPEPSTFSLLGIAFIGLFGYAWRRKRAA